MAARTTFPTGAARLVRDWETGGVYRAMLLQSTWTPDVDVDVFVSDVSPHEFSDASYGRVTATNPARTVNVAARSVVYTADAFAFGVISGGEVAEYLALYAEVTNDSDSPLVAAYLIDYEADGVPAATFTAPGGVAFRLNSTCPESSV